MDLTEDNAVLIAQLLRGEVNHMELMIQGPLLDKRIAAVRQVAFKFADAWRYGRPWPDSHNIQKGVRK